MLAHRIFAPLALALAACRPPTPTVAGVPVAPGFDLQGHRGARGLRPENTLPAVETALDLGVTTLELDLHWTRDEVLVVWHDPVIVAAKCTGPGVTDAWDRAPAIRGLRYPALAAFSCSRNPDTSRFPGQRAQPTALAGDDFRITRLEGVLDFVDAYARASTKTREQRAGAAAVHFNLELKRVEAEPWRIDDGFDGEHPGPFEKALIGLVRDRGLESRVTIQSFDHRSLRAIHGVAPDLELAALTESDTDLAALARAGIRVWSPAYTVLSAERVQAAHDAGLRVIPWTVNEARIMAELIEMGVDGIISDLGGDVTFSNVRAR